MKTVDRVLELIVLNPGISGAEIAEKLGVTRQAVNRHVRRLIEDNLVAKTGTTRGAGYARVSDDKPKESPRVQFRREYGTTGLEEDRVFRDLALFLGLEKRLSPSAFVVFRYGFTEMLNNAIDHSDAPTCTVSARVDEYWVEFEVRDGGIGIFASVASKFRLSTEVEAVLELSKGKRTSKPDRHAGEGVFFTSKCADRLEISSHAIGLTYDNAKQDIYVEEIPDRAGTTVNFRLRRRSRRKLQSIFEEYSPEEFDFRFERTRVKVRLLSDRYASRSEARRLLAGLEKFSEIILDFKGTAGIGQGFADEVFRIFPAQHPDLEIHVENANPLISRMIAHVRAART